MSPIIYLSIYLYVSMYVSDTKAELVLSSPLEVNWDMIFTLASLIGTLCSSLICRWDFDYILYSFWDINDNYVNWPIN